MAADEGKAVLHTTIRVRRYACEPCQRQRDTGDCEHFLTETQETVSEEITLEEAAILGVHRP